MNSPFTDETVALCDEMARDASPLGAYAIGMACVATIQTGRQPTRNLLIEMRNATSVKDAARRLLLFEMETE